MRRPGKLRPLLLIFLVGVAGWGLWYSRSTAPKGKVILDQDVDDYFLYAFDTKKPVVCFSLECDKPVRTLTTVPYFQEQLQVPSKMHKEQSKRVE
jgi:hypothetical protein